MVNKLVANNGLLARAKQFQKFAFFVRLGLLARATVITQTMSLRDRILAEVIKNSKTVRLSTISS